MGDNLHPLMTSPVCFVMKHTNECSSDEQHSSDVSLT